MKQNILLKTFVLLIAMLAGGISASWGQTETISGADSPSSKDNPVAKTSVTILSTYIPSGNTTINSKSCMKIRCKRSDSSTGNQAGFALKVNDGYKITSLSVQMSGNQGTFSLSKIVVDGNEYTGTYEKTINSSTASEGNKYTEIELTGIEATQYINFVHSGSTDEKDQGFVYMTITYEELGGVTATPTISFSGNTVTLACTTSGATIYYTTDGSDPATSETKETYEEAFTIDNSCTVRAIAIKGETASTEATKDCYVTYSDAFAVLNYNGGTLSDGNSVWTSEDGNFTLTDNLYETNNNYVIGYSNLAGNQDGFKLNANDTYTLQPSEEFKITKIIAVGKTWLSGTASTMSVDKFTPASESFFDADADRNTYVKTIEFTSDELAYGEAAIISVGVTQLGAYFVIYGEERKGPADPETYSSLVTETVTFNADGAVSTNADVITMTGGLKDPTYQGYTKAMEMNSNAAVTINLPEGASNANVTLFGTNASTSLKINSDTKTSVTWTGDETNGYTLTINIPDENAGSTFTISKGDGSSRIHKITLTYSMGESDGIILTTTANMAGWRSFYDADQAYTVDENTTVYAVTEVEGTAITLTDFEGGIPAGTPVVLKTDAEAETDGTFKMTLTKAESVTATVPAGNMLQASSAAQALSGVYRLGFGDTGVGFYAYSTSSAAAGIVYLETESGAPMLSLGFGDEGTTGIDVINANVKVAPRKVLKDGRIVIETSEGTFLMNGARVK